MFKNFIIAFLIIMVAFFAVLIVFYFKEARKEAKIARNSPFQTSGDFSELDLFDLQAIKEKETENLPHSDLRIPVLMYHYIRDYSNSSDPLGTNLSVPIEKFVGQLEEIKRQGFKTITFWDVKNNLIPQKSLILTFDDGYDDFYFNAWPELKKRNFKAVVFIITDRIGQNGYLNEEQILELNFSGIEIGSHSVSHPNLTNLSLPKAYKEIYLSKKELEQIINKKVISFSYPAGKTNKTISVLIKKAGYGFAVGSEGGEAEFSKPFELNRFRINRNTLLTSFLK